MSGHSSDIDEEAFRSGTSSVGVALTVAVGSIALLASMTADIVALIGIVGLFVMVIGTLKPSRKTLGIGAFVLFSAVLTAGILGGSELRLLIAAGATLVAWDVGENAISVGKQLGLAARTVRVEVLHAIASVVVAIVIGSVTYGMYLLALAHVPTATVVFLTIAVILLAWSFDR